MPWTATRCLFSLSLPRCLPHGPLYFLFFSVCSTHFPFLFFILFFVIFLKSYPHSSTPHFPFLYFILFFVIIKKKKKKKKLSAWFVVGRLSSKVKSCEFYIYIIHVMWRHWHGISNPSFIFYINPLTTSHTITVFFKSLFYFFYLFFLHITPSPPTSSTQKYSLFSLSIFLFLLLLLNTKKKKKKQKKKKKKKNKPFHKLVISFMPGINPDHNFTQKKKKATTTTTTNHNDFVFFPADGHTPTSLLYSTAGLFFLPPS
ncbi:unnamed protein product [Camellia sinensis]